MVKKNYLTCFIFLYIFICLWGKFFLPNLTNSREPEQEPLEREKKAGAGAAWETNQEPELEPEPEP